MNNKLKAQVIRHGEVIIKPIDSLPKGAILVEITNKKIVAFSETHHHHVLEAQKPFKVWTWNGETYLEVLEIAELWHQKTGKDVHAPHKIAPGFKKVQIKKVYDYFAKKMSLVKD